MALIIPIHPLLRLTLFLLFTQLANSVFVPEIKNQTELEPHASTYIVQVDPLAKPPHFATHDNWYSYIVASGSPAANSSRVVYVYDTVMHGFAAELSDGQARRLANTTGVAGVYKNRVVPLHTTRSPGFFGLDTEFGMWPETDFGDGVIIGFIDTGIWPESFSFNDTMLGPVRKSWKGRCEDGQRFNKSMCNNKLVGARFFLHGPNEMNGDEFQSPRDAYGHGTHVSSTAAGSEVPGANFFGFAHGTARGVAPRARIAMYKACALHHGCPLDSIIAAIDAAVKDGVDVLSLSIGGHDKDFYDNPFSIALFGAVRAGVFVACSAGNGGPAESSLSNEAPWIMTVGAATVDRVFPVTVTLGDGQVLTGQSLYTEKANGTEMLPLLLSSCDKDALVPDKIMGKVVVCKNLYAEGGVDVQKGGGSGLISLQTYDWRMDGIDVQAFTLPSISLGSVESEKLEAYIHSGPHPVASFRVTCDTVIGENRAPMVASFSSRGPNYIVREILKPDVIAPGTSILAAWPDELPLATSDDPRRSGFNIISGTSMACPHVAGVAALLRHKHHDWTPAMIRSAIMTTATMLNNHGRAIADNGLVGGGRATPFAAGSGFVQPRMALDPGLVYDAAEQDYVEFLCTLNYTTAQIRLFVPGFTGCTRTLPGGAGDLNYPSFVVAFGNGTNGTDVVRVLERTVTKVSEVAETYTVRVEAPDQLVAVTVTPATLEFGKQKGEKKSYKVVFRSSSPRARGAAKNETRFGNIVWENDVHQVTSPVVFIWGCI